MKYVDLERGIILNEIERSNFKQLPCGTKLVKCGRSYKIEQLDLVPIDDQLAVPIAIFNLKGYKTKYCCAGHLDEGVAWSYIKFEDPIFKNEEAIETDDVKVIGNELISIDEDKKTIRVSDRLDRERDLIKVQKYIDDFCQLMLRWALALPYKPKEIKVEDIGIIATDNIPRMGTFIDENTMLLGDKK